MERDRTMTGQQLKNAILALAVQGKLVPQDPKDEPATALLERVKAEKARLVKVGKIKKEKTLPPITDAEKPFVIPVGWEWIRLGDIGVWGSGATPSKSNPEFYNNASIPWLVTGDLNDGIIEEIPGKISQLALEKTSVQLNPANSVLVAMYGATIGKVGLLSFPATTNQACCACQIFDENNVWYLMYFLMSQRNSFIKKGAGGAQPNISKEKIVITLMPLPPIEEQKRIVAKIEELLPLVESYDKAEQKISGIDADFPDKLKKSILQQAVQGKLAKQDKNDEPASELLKRIKAAKERLIAEGKIKKERPLPPITEEEKPFEIPAGWEWVRLGTLCCKIGSGNTPTGGRSSDVYKTSGVPLLREQNIYADGLRYEGLVYISEELSQTRQGSKVYAKDLLLNITGGSIGRCAIVPNDFHIGDINQHVLIIRLIEPELRGYIHTYICSPLGQSIINTKAVGARAGFSAEKCKNMVVPLPPMEEGKRIVVKTDELLCYARRIEKKVFV